MSSSSQLNTREYWEARFNSKDWLVKGGARQSYQHALHFVPLLSIAPDFSGTICDFGCAEGDAIPVYRGAFPDARLIGIDFSQSAISAARVKYGEIADFVCGDISTVPKVDVIVCSHTLEHLEDDVEILENLLQKAQSVFIVVPYRESPLSREHLRRYDEESYRQFAPVSTQVVRGGWPFGWPKRIFQIYLKNIVRILFAKPMRREPQQIVFHFEGTSG